MKKRRRRLPRRSARAPFRTVPLQVNLEHYPQAEFIRGTSILVPEEHARIVHETDVVEEKYWYWDEKGAALYIMTTQELGYDILDKTRALLEREMPNILKKAFEFFERAHPNTKSLPPIELVALGVGSAAKENAILKAIIGKYGYPRELDFGPVHYIPVDISFPLLQNSLRTVFADKHMRKCIFRESLYVRPILTDFLMGLPGFLKKDVSKLIVAQGIVWNAPIPLIFAAFKNLMTSDSLLLIDVEFVGGRKNEQILSNYGGAAVEAFCYHPLELLCQAAQTKHDDHFIVNGQLVRYSEAFSLFSERNGNVIADIAQRSTLDDFINKHNLSSKAKSKIRLSPGQKSKTVVILYKPKVQRGNLRTIVLGYSTRFEYEEFQNFLKDEGFEMEGEWLDNQENPERAIFGHYLLRLGNKGKCSGGAPKPDIYIVSDKETEQWGIIGKSDGSYVKFGLDKAHTVFVCGNPRSGKGYTVGVLCEMLVGKSIPKISKVSEKERATIIVLHKSKDERSEFWSMTESNDNPEECAKLKDEYGVEPYELVSKDKVRIFVDPSIFVTSATREFKEEYGTDDVFPFSVNPSTITADDWNTILSTVGSVGTQAETIAKRVFYTIKKVKEESSGIVSIDRVKTLVQKDKLLSDQQRAWAISTLTLLEPYLADGNREFVSKLKKGGVNIFDFREKGELTLHPADMFSIMTLVFSVIQTSKELKDRSVVLVIDEAHEYFKKGMSEQFVGAIEDLLRRFGHRRKWLILNTQSPEDVHPRVVEFADVKIVHSLAKPTENGVLKRALGEFVNKYKLPRGQAYIVAESSENRPILVNIRPRLTKHGGSSKTLIE